MVKSEFIFLGHLSNKQSYGLWVFFFFFDLNCMMYIPLSFTIDRVFFVFLLAIWSLFKMFSTSNVVLLLVGLRFLSNLLPKYISSDSEVLLACSKKIAIQRWSVELSFRNYFSNNWRVQNNIFRNRICIEDALRLLCCFSMLK
jgi:hypothetical protein